MGLSAQFCLPVVEFFWFFHTDHNGQINPLIKSASVPGSVVSRDWFGCVFFPSEPL